MSYKKSLNLPSTTFPMKANLGHLESNILCYWNNLGIYDKMREARKGRPKFILHDGPPYANGRIHIGHALNKILKDIIVRYKFLQDFDCPFIAGWDCHGLPVEHQLFKNLNLTKHDVDIVDFRRRAAEFALKFVELQKEDFKRLGIFSAWDSPYLTLNTDYEYGVLKLLEILVGDGFVYRGRKPVNWCCECETALAEAEVEYADKDSHSMYFMFGVQDHKGLLEDDVCFLVWTTTPWTVVSNVAVALHPQLEYCLVSGGGKKLIIAGELVALVQEESGHKFEIIKSFTGQALEGIILKHPFIARQVPVVLADFVSSVDGSGCVHIAPGHGAEDFSLTKKYSLPVIMPVNDKGVFDAPDDFQGKDIEQANQLVLSKLDDRGLLLAHKKIRHSYPHCWRCKKPIIFRATFQWFLNVDHNDLRRELLDKINTVDWVPSSGEDRMRSMISLRPDWCLSRQRLWGIPIPSLKCRICEEVTLDSRVVARAAAVFIGEGSDAWFVRDTKYFLPDDFVCPSCGSSDFIKEFDILDVWFESGASFFSVLKSNPDLSFPADLYLEGSDQHRGWFQVSFIPSVASENIAPFKTILTHGFVVDQDGHKMSKSLGNVMSPQEIITTHGAEIMRLWAAYSDYSEDVKISPDIIKQLVDMYRKIRNTIRFILGSIYDFDPDACEVDIDSLCEVDRYMLSRVMLFAQETIACYDVFSFYKVCQKIFSFCNLDLSSFYLDILKDRLYTFSPNSPQRRSAQFVLFHIFNVILKLMAPILSFTAEEAYFACKNFKDRKESVFILTLDECIKPHWIDSGLMSVWNRLLNLRAEVYKEMERKREKQIVKSSLQAKILITAPGDDYRLFTRYRDILKEVFIVSDVIINEGDFQITIVPAEGKKCLRCWNWTSDVGLDPKFSDVCARCAKVLSEIKFQCKQA